MNFFKILTLLVLSHISLQAETTPQILATSSINACAEIIGETCYNIHIPISYYNAESTAMLTKHINLFDLSMTTAGTTAAGMLISIIIKAIADYKECEDQEMKDTLRYKIALLTGTLAITLAATGICLHHIIQNNPVTSADVI